MNVRELKELLSQFDDNMEVMVSQPTGNYWRMVKAVPIEDRDVDEGVVEYSAYLYGDKVVDEEDRDEMLGLEETKQRVVVLIG
jgi:hypothetical protein